jgi:hypothetical protein
MAICYVLGAEKQLCLFNAAKTRGILKSQKSRLSTRLRAEARTHPNPALKD